MSKEKQIEEIAKFTCNSCELGVGFTGECCVGEDYKKCGLSIETATAIYNAGYRKQSDKESKGCEYCKGRAYTKKPLTVITKYGRKIELVFEFCPNCGRKMKGGA
jgi:hypothetical protein